MAKSIGGDKSIRKKGFDPEKYGMLVCPDCKSEGYVETPKRQCCPRCGGFGFIKNGQKACNNGAEGD